jgi:hypothetical protein
MRAFIAVMLATVAVAGQALAVDPPSCAVPDYLLFSDNNLKQVATAVGKEHRLSVVVFGTGSSTLAGPDGTAIAYPARLEAALNQRLAGTTIKVATRTKSGQTADMMRRNMKDLLIDARPDLVIWQTGTVDAIRRIEPDDFRAALDAGVDTLQAAGADVILMNMQYSPRTESMLDVSAYADVMRVVAQQRGALLFDRLALMHYWNDEGTFDLYAATKKYDMARRVHDCIGRGLASQIINAAHLDAVRMQTTR